MITCDDGPRPTIDLRDFIVQYSRLSVTFEAEAQGRGKIATKVEPTQARPLSEAVQRAAEFRNSESTLSPATTVVQSLEINTPGLVRAFNLWMRLSVGLSNS